MSVKQIPNLPSVAGITGNDQLEAVQSGTSVYVTANQIAAFTAAAYPAPGIATVDGTAPIAASTVGNAVTISLNSQGITNSFLAPMAAGTVKANVTVGSASPTDATVSQVLDVIGSTKGNILYRDTSSWAALTGGTNGQVLTAQGTTAVPIWTTLSVPSGQIAPTGVVAGTYGSASTVPQYTVLASGQLSAASNVPIVIPYTSVTGLGSIATQNASNVAITGGTIDGTAIGGVTPASGTFTTLTSTGATNLGTIASGVWNGTAIGVSYGGTGATTASGARSNLGAAASGANSDITSLSGLTTPLSGPQGGTGFGSYTTGDLLYADTSSTLARLNDVATGNALISGGVGVAPSYGKIGLTTHVSGTLPVANGGTGATTLTGYVYGNGTGAFTAAATIPNAGLTNSSVTIGSTSIALGGTATTLAGLTTVTLTQDPTLALEASTKQYVDSQVATVSNQTFHTACYAATTANLTATYSNGTGGVGATLTNSGSLAAFSTDGQSPPINSRILVKNQTSGLQNGIYTLTTVGSGAIAWVLTRATDFDTVGSGPNQIETGAATFINNGNLYGASGWVMTTTGTLVVGTTSFVFSQTSSSSSVTVSSPLLKTGSNIELTTVPTTLGGTGLTTLTEHSVMIGNGTGNVAFATPSTTGYPLLSTGASSDPAFGQLSLTAGVTGTLPVANGGTGTSTAFTAGSIVFAGASGTYSQSNSELFWNNSSNFLGIGTGSPDAVLTIVSPTQTSVTAGTLPAGTDLHIVGADSAITRITQDAFGTGNYVAFTGRSSRGTAAAPTASQANDALAQFTARGYGATGYSSNSIAYIGMYAAENFTDTAQGSYIDFETTNLGSSSVTRKFRVGSEGQWGIHSGGSPDYGTSGYVFTSGGASARPTWSQVSASSLTGVLPVANGGTNISSYTIGDLLYADGTTSLAKLADIATGNVLLSGGVGAAPSYGKVGLTTHVSGTLPITNGGTGITSTPTDGQLLIGSTSGAGYALGTLTASTGISVTNGAGSITIANTGVTSLTAGTNISVSAATGGVTISTTSTPTWTSETVPLISGGTTASSTLTLQSTSGAGTSDAVIFKTGSQVERMRITTDGSVGIGIASPGVKLNVYASFANSAIEEIVRISRAGGTGAYGSTRAAALSFYDENNPTLTAAVAGVREAPAGNYNGSLAFYTSGTGSSSATTISQLTERMRIDSSGNVGIGTSSPSTKLDVSVAGGMARVGGGSGNNLIQSYTGSVGGGIWAGGVTRFYSTGAMTLSTNATIGTGAPTGTVDAVTIDASGNVGIGTTSQLSGARLSIADSAVKTSSSTPLVLGTATGGSNDFQLTFTRSASGSGAYYSIQSVEQGVAYRDIVLQNSGGYVGIANSTPANTLDVKGILRLTNSSNTANFGQLYDGGGLVVSSANSNPMYFYTGGSERARFGSDGLFQANAIASAGSSGMPSTVSGNAVWVGGFTSPTSGRILIGDGTGWQFYISSRNSGTTTDRFTFGDTGNFTASGNVTAYSDARLKTNVSTIDNALALVEKMRGVRYDRIDSGKAGIGVIAQEMQEVVPEVVHEGEEHLSVAYGNLVGVLIEAVKELSARVKELEAK
jgi:hypothetical protein